MHDGTTRMLRWAHLPECEAPAPDWLVCRFTEVADVIAGQSPPSETYNQAGNGIPFLQGNGDFSDRCPAAKVWCSAPARIARIGDTLISVRAPVGEVNRADQNYAIGRGLAALRATTCDPDFLFQAMQRWRWCLQRVAQGTTFDAVTARHFGQLSVALPKNSTEQAAIARILDGVDTAVEQTRAAVERAQEVKRSLVQRLFSEGLRGEGQRKSVIGFVPKSWDVVAVDTVVSQFQYGLSVPMQLKGVVPILRMGNIQDGGVVFNELKYVSFPDTVIQPYLVKRGDVLFNRTNSQEWVGKVGIYRSDERVVFASYLIRPFPNPMKIDGYFLGHALNSYSAQCRIKRYATPGVQQVNINATNLGKVLIPLPVGPAGLAEQREIAGILEQADAVIRRYEPVLQAQRGLKRALMQDLLTGRVRIDLTKAGARDERIQSG
jgi:type I restriction enzyme S subunit